MSLGSPALLLLLTGSLLGLTFPLGKLAAALADLATVPAVAAGQVLASTAMFSLFFRLQQVGGPTYLSQIGYVGAAIALLVGTGVLGERYAWPTWAGALVILIGIALSVLAEQHRADAAVTDATDRGPATSLAGKADAK